MIVPHVSLLFAGLLALLQTLLTALVIMRRKQTGVILLDNGDPLLIRRMRAHGNFVETVPIALLLLTLLEFNGLAAVWLAAFGVLLIAGRVLHAYGLISEKAHRARLAGMCMTLFVISVEGAVAVGLSVSSATR